MQLIRTALLALLVACGGEDVTPLIDAPAQPDAATDAPAVVPDASIDAAVDAGPDAPSVCDNEMRDDTYVAGLTKTGPAGYDVVLMTSSPAPGATGNYDWSIRVLDPADQPLDGAAITVRPFMPDHGHGTTPTPVVTSQTGGEYRISPINLYMSGYWTIRVTLRDSAGTSLDVVTFAFCVAAG